MNVGDGGKLKSAEEESGLGVGLLGAHAIKHSCKERSYIYRTYIIIKWLTLFSQTTTRSYTMSETHRKHS